MTQPLKPLALLVVAALILLAPARASDLPFLDGQMRAGVPSCSTAGCHGDQVTGPGAGPVVGQNEYFKWRSAGQAGAHSRAYEALTSPWGKRIAANLGIGKAHEAKLCLDCHADNVAPALHAQRFQLSDGVGCEACHGGAQEWLAFHRIGAGHQENIDRGLFPTEEPAPRADLCLSCHLGSDAGAQFVSHRIMGAGHPRLKFELDLYTEIQAHHVVDDDYRARKRAAPGSEVWAVGQAAALTRMLELLIDDDKGVDGVFPELFFFDCHACHQPIERGVATLGWRPNPGRGLGPGVPVVQDAHLVMLLAAMKTLDPALAEKLEREGRALHSASRRGRSSMKQAANALLKTSRAATQSIDGVDFTDPGLTKSMLRVIVSEEMARHYTDYSTGEQALFAVQRLTAALGPEGDKLTAAIERASKFAQSPYDYNATGFRRSLSEIATMIE